MSSDSATAAVAPAAAVGEATAAFRKIILKTADDETFEVDEPVAMEFATVKTFFDDNTGSSADDSVVPLPNVQAAPLAKIIAYIKKQLDFQASNASEDERKKYNKEFLAEQTGEDLKELILVANYLEISVLLDLLNQAVADFIKNKSVKFVRAYFGIENDYTPEEEERLTNEHAWAYENVDED